MKMSDLSSKMELLTGDIFDELRKAFVQQLAALEYLAKQAEKPVESETAPDNPQGHQKILEFPVDLFFEEADDE